MPAERQYRLTKPEMVQGDIEALRKVPPVKKEEKPVKKEEKPVKLTVEESWTLARAYDGDDSYLVAASPEREGVQATPTPQVPRR